MTYQERIDSERAMMRGLCERLRAEYRGNPGVEVTNTDRDGNPMASVAINVVGDPRHRGVWIHLRTFGAKSGTVEIYKSVGKSGHYAPDNIRAIKRTADEQIAKIREDMKREDSAEVARQYRKAAALSLPWPQGCRVMCECRISQDETYRRPILDVVFPGDGTPTVLVTLDIRQDAEDVTHPTVTIAKIESYDRIEATAALLAALSVAVRAQ